MRHFMCYFCMVIVSPSTNIASEPHEREPPTRPVKKSQEKAPVEAKSGLLFWPEPAKMEGSLSTDRPGFSTSAFLVPRGHAHLEIGHVYAYDQEKHTETQTHLVPGTSLRVGLLDDLELRLGWNGMSLTESKFRDESPRTGRRFNNHQHDDGGGDMSAGFKFPILKHSDTNDLPNLSLVPTISLPTGSASKTTGDVDPSLLLAWNYPVTSKFSLYGIGSVASISDSEGRFVQSAGSFAGSYTISDQWSFFVEYFGIYPNTRNSDCQHNINGGPVFLITDNIQLDLAVGMGLNEEAPDFFVNWGLSIRF